MILERLSDANVRDAIVGDFEERFQDYARDEGVAAAARDYWCELLRSAPVLTAERILLLLTRSVAMNDRSFFEGRAPAVLGLLAMVPSMFLFSAVFAQFVLNDEPLAGKLAHIAHPLPLLLGLATAILLNTASVLRVRHEATSGALVATFQWRGRLLHVAVCMLACLVLAVILAYAVTENFTIVPRQGPR